MIVNDLQVTTTLIIFNTTFLTLSTTLPTNLYPLTGPSPLQGPWMLWRHMQPRLRPPCSTTTTTTTSGQSSIPATHPTAPPAIFLRPPSKWNLVSFNFFKILIGHFKRLIGHFQLSLALCILLGPELFWLLHFRENSHWGCCIFKWWNYLLYEVHDWSNHDNHLAIYFFFLHTVRRQS